jgi:DNA polymerase-3 subunit chi
MTRVDFYVSNNTEQDAGLMLACRIAEKAYNLSNNVYIHTDNPATAGKLDDLLWTFKQGSFIPHCLSSAGEFAESGIVIGYGDLPAISPQVLINIGDKVPEFFTRFERIAEIVAGDEHTRQVARERFKFYRERGYPLETHELSS